MERSEAQISVLGLAESGKRSAKELRNVVVGLVVSAGLLTLAYIAGTLMQHPH